MIETLDSSLIPQNISTKVDTAKDVSELGENDSLVVIGHGILISLFI